MAERPKRAVKKKAPLTVTGLAAAFKTAPELSSPKVARARVEAWLVEIAHSASGKAIKHLLAPAKSEKLGDVVAAIAETSPYLWELIRADPDRFLTLLEGDPRTRLIALIADIQH